MGVGMVQAPAYPGEGQGGLPGGGELSREGLDLAKEAVRSR